MVKDGRFGPYVTDGETNASLRKGDDVEDLTMERALELLADRRARGPVKKKKAAAKKKAPAEEEGRGEEEGPGQEEEGGGQEEGPGREGGEQRDGTGGAGGRPTVVTGVRR